MGPIILYDQKVRHIEYSPKVTKQTMSPMTSMAMTIVKIPRAIFPHLMMFVFVFESILLSSKDREASVNMRKV